MAAKKKDAGSAAAAMGAGFEEIKPFTAAANPVGADRDALLARIAELEAELAGKGNVQTSAPAAVPSGPLRFFRVDLQHAPSRIVRAVDSANAWEEFRKRSGIITSDYQPTVSEAEGPAGRFTPRGEFIPDLVAA